MMTESTVEAGSLVSSQEDVTRKLRRMALAIPVIALIVAAALTAFEPRFGLFGAALIFGWTQLVSL